MRLLIYSDLHLEFGPFDPPDADVDLLILAGDVHTKQHGIKWIGQNFPDLPTIYVLGNHEFYGKVYPRQVEKLKLASIATKVHVLENESLEIGEVAFFGCTLWTDFALFGDPRIAGYEASKVITDFKRIRREPSYSKLRTIDAAGINRRSVHWLKQAVASCKKKKKVVVTHHAPSPRSLPSAIRNDIVSAAYASNLEELIGELSPELWIHGHIHSSCDYRVGTTRVICNPRGYNDWDNPEFKRSLVVVL